MPPMPPREDFESELDRDLPLAERNRRRDVRWLFYAMVLGRTEKGPIGKSERKRLARYGVELGLDGFESQLLVTGAEYRSQNVPKLRLVRPEEFEARLWV